MAHGKRFNPEEVPGRICVLPDCFGFEIRYPDSFNLKLYLIPLSFYVYSGTGFVPVNRYITCHLLGKGRRRSIPVKEKNGMDQELMSQRIQLNFPHSICRVVFKKMIGVSRPNRCPGPESSPRIFPGGILNPAGLP